MKYQNKRKNVFKIKMTQKGSKRGSNTCPQGNKITTSTHSTTGVSIHSLTKTQTIKYILNKVQIPDFQLHLQPQDKAIVPNSNLLISQSF